MTEKISGEPTIDAETYGVRFPARLVRHWKPYFGILSAVLVVDFLARLPQEVDEPIFDTFLAFVVYGSIAVIWGCIIYGLIAAVLAIRRPGGASRDGTRSPR